MNMKSFECLVGVFEMYPVIIDGLIHSTKMLGTICAGRSWDPRGIPERLSIPGCGRRFRIRTRSPSPIIILWQRETQEPEVRWWGAMRMGLEASAC